MWSPLPDEEMTFAELMKGNDPRCRTLERFVSWLESIDKLVKETLKLDSGGPTVTARRMKSSYFNSDKKYQVQRNIIADSFVEYIMSEAGFVKTSRFTNTKNTTQATSRIYRFADE